MCGHPGPWCFTWLFFILSSSSSSSPPWAVSSKALCSREFSPCQALTSCRDKGRGRERAGAPQPTPPPGDRPGAGAATASPESPSIRAGVAPAGPSPPGEHAANVPAGAKAKQAPEQGRQRGRRPQEAERSPSARERSTRGCGAQVPSRAPLCSARALAAIAFLRLYWKVEEVASANRGNGVKFQLGLSLPSGSVVAVLATSLQQPLAYLRSVPKGLLQPPALQPLSSLGSGILPVPSSGARTLRPKAVFGEGPSPRHHGSPDHRPTMLIQGWERGCLVGVRTCTAVHACASVSACAQPRGAPRGSAFESMFLQSSWQQRVEAINTAFPGLK